MSKGVVLVSLRDLRIDCSAISIAKNSEDLGCMWLVHAFLGSVMRGFHFAKGELKCSKLIRTIVLSLWPRYDLVLAILV